MAQPLKLDLAPHERQLGKYRLLAKLGEGGMGTVYLALASGFGSFRKLLVVKELRRDLPWRESSLAMFMDEAQLAARLDHPNVLQTFEAGEAEGRHFLAMEYLDGQPLSVVLERARRSGGLPIELSVHILCEALSGLAYAHDLTDFDGASLNVVHRDVSPQNVFITYHGQVKVVDFGVAKANNSSSMTSPGMFKGKFAYAAPEQLLGRPMDGRCDVFAVGVMLWEAMSGRRFSESTPSAPAFRTRASGAEPRIRQLVPDADPTLADICDRALQVEPDDRFENADTMRVELESWLVAHGGHVQPAQLGLRMRELFSEDRKQRNQIIEESMLEAGATHSVMQQLPIHDLAPEPPPPPRGRMESGTGLRPAARTQEREASCSHSHSAAPSPERARVPKPGATAGPAHLGQSKAQRAQPKPSSANATSAAILCALAIAVFAITYKLSSSVATSTSVSAATSGAAEQLPPTAAPSPAAPARAVAAAAEPRAEDARATDKRAAAADEVKKEATSDVAAAEPATVRAPARAANAQAASKPGDDLARSVPRDTDKREKTAQPRAASQALRGADGQGVLPLAASKHAAQPMAAKPETIAGKKPVLRVRSDPALGSDLRELRRAAPLRNIDVEDPYQ